MFKGLVNDIGRTIVAFGVAAALFYGALRLASKYPLTSGVAGTVRRFTSPGS